jgi:8-oxo-dGTP pyrophosphatase MutT (NUDIX family)
MTKRKAKILFYQKTPRGTRILFGKRVSKEGEEFWWMPGGSVEEGESEFEGAVRELYEEIVPVRYMEAEIEKIETSGRLPEFVRYNSGSSIGIVFFIKIDESISTVEIIECREEFEEMRWFLMGELPFNMSRDYKFIKEYLDEKLLHL